MAEETGKKDVLTVRRMTEEDVASATVIDRLSFSLPWSEYAFRHEVTGNENARAWVAEVQNTPGQRVVIGVVVIWLVLDEAHVGTIAIHPNHRREGVGRRLMDLALAEAAKEGASLVYLEVRRSNLPAIHMYQEMGFKIVGERKKYYQDNGEDALLMTLPDLKSTVSKN
ncbi:MAG: ribosomal protein S18-alanine N-acetyltransferase [Anaerolineaceae bacterium]